MAPPRPTRPPMAQRDECPLCHGKIFNVLGRLEESPGRWTEHRECANAWCKAVYRWPIRLV